jgi:hypothetical protein
MADALLGIRPGEGLCIARNKRRLIGVMTADRLRDAALADALEELESIGRRRMGCRRSEASASKAVCTIVNARRPRRDA